MSGHEDEHVIYDVTISHAATASNVSDATTVISCGDRDGIRKYLWTAAATGHCLCAGGSIPLTRTKRKRR